MKTYGSKFNISYDDAMEMEHVQGTRTVGKIFSKETYLENITYLKTKRGAYLAIVGTVWKFHPSNIIEYIVQRAK